MLKLSNVSIIIGLIFAIYLMFTILLPTEIVNHRLYSLICSILIFIPVLYICLVFAIDLLNIKYIKTKRNFNISFPRKGLDNRMMDILSLYSKFLVSIFLNYIIFAIGSVFFFLFFKYSSEIQKEGVYYPVIFLGLSMFSIVAIYNLINLKFQGDE